MLILLFVTTLLLTEIITTEVLVCEKESSSISCPEFTNIHINNAFFGRTSQLKCPKNRYDQNVNCEDNNATEITRERCEGEQNCTVTADISEYGDPCYGVYKYLDINYTCVANTDHAIVCENNELNLECPRDNVLEIKSADFGRHSNKICPYKDHDQYTQCSLNVTNKVAEKCNGQRSCKMEVNNNEFGQDPCQSTYKYLNVHYICKLRPGITRYYQIACFDLTLTIVCRGDTTLKILSADYGRTSENICRNNQSNQTKSCIVDETPKLAQRCDGLHTCIVNVNKNDFPTDVCYGTYNYLYVLYYCPVTNEV